MAFLKIWIEDSLLFFCITHCYKMLDVVLIVFQLLECTTHYQKMLDVVLIYFMQLECCSIYWCSEPFRYQLCSLFFLSSIKFILIWNLLLAFSSSSNLSCIIYNHEVLLFPKHSLRFQHILGNQKQPSYMLKANIANFVDKSWHHE